MSRSRLRALAALVGAGLLAAAPAAACDTCYGAASDSPLVNSARLGVILLLAVTVVVLGGFAGFIVHLRNRARQYESDSIASEWAQLQESSLP